MRNVVLQMMTTLNGRVDEPFAWISGVPDDLYRSVDEAYATFDTILVGHTTFEEMASYWPGALKEPGDSATNLAMARKMSAYRKVVVTRNSSLQITPWANSEAAAVRSDAEMVALVQELRAQPGRDIHLAGGATLVQSLARLGLIDRYRLYVHPVISAGKSWHEDITGPFGLQVRNTERFGNGAVLLDLEPSDHAAKAEPASFTELLT